ncbi:unnamed protein product [Closterium sp. NIES-64]|nr:unnamed protein product [Closterium sp. NIES-64]
MVSYDLLVVAVAWDMECTGSSCSPPNPPKPLTHLSSVLSLQVEGRGVVVNTTTRPHHSPVAVQVAGVGGEGGSTPLGWDGMGEYRDGVVWNKHQQPVRSCSRGTCGQAKGWHSSQRESRACGLFPAAQGASGGLEARREECCHEGEYLRLLTLEWQWRGTWNAQAAAALHPTFPQLSAGEGCGVGTAIPSRLSPVAVQGGTHTGRLGGGLPGKESPGAAAAALYSSQVQVPPQVQSLGLQFVTWPLPVAPPLSRLANAVPSLAVSTFIPSLPTDQLCVCALQLEGRGGGQHRRSPTPLPCGRAGHLALGIMAL